MRARALRCRLSCCGRLRRLVHRLGRAPRPSPPPSSPPPSCPPRPPPPHPPPSCPPPLWPSSPWSSSSRPLRGRPVLPRIVVARSLPPPDWAVLAATRRGRPGVRSFARRPGPGRALSRARVPCKDPAARTPCMDPCMDPWPQACCRRKHAAGASMLRADGVWAGGCGTRHATSGISLGSRAEDPGCLLLLSTCSNCLHKLLDLKNSLPNVPNGSRIVCQTI